MCTPYFWMDLPSRMPISRKMCGESSTMRLFGTFERTRFGFFEFEFRNQVKTSAKTAITQRRLGFDDMNF